MRLPYLNMPAQKTERQILQFRGLNLSDNLQDGDFTSTKNISTARYPVLSQRKGRDILAEYQDVSDIFPWEELVVVSLGQLYYGGAAITAVNDKPKQFAVVGTKLVVWPDKIYIDLTNNQVKHLEATATAASEDTTTTTNKITINPNPIVESNKRWGFGVGPIDTHPEEAYVLTHRGLQWTGTNWTWTSRQVKACLDVDIGDQIIMETNESVPSSYGNIESVWKNINQSPPDASLFTDFNQNGFYGTVINVEGFARSKYEREFTYLYMDVRNNSEWDGNLENQFAAGDVVKITGSVLGNNRTLKISSVTANTMTFASNTLVAGAETGNIAITREVPDLAFICESDNRLWGVSNEAVGEIWDTETESYKPNTSRVIYASALGDPTNFFVYDGLSTDSYAVAVASDGDFTGCVAFSSTVIFFKDDLLYKMMGSYPAQYTLYRYELPGVEIGSERSIMVINETLYYKGTNGVYAYSGGAPILISDAFGSERYNSAVAGTDGERYYVSMMDRDNAPHLMVYDLRKRLWVEEDNTRAADFALFRGELHLLNSEDSRIYAVNTETDFVSDWLAELAPMDESYLGKKVYSKLYLRAELDAGAFLIVEIRIDGGDYSTIYTTHNENKKTFQIPIMPNRCDTFQIRLSGEGGCVIKSILREMMLGSSY